MFGYTRRQEEEAEVVEERDIIKDLGRWGRSSTPSKDTHNAPIAIKPPLFTSVTFGGARRSHPAGIKVGGWGLQQTPHVEISRLALFFSS